MPTVDANPDDVYNAFLAELRNLGYVEGKNVSIDWRASGVALDHPHVIAPLWKNAGCSAALRSGELWNW